MVRGGERASRFSAAIAGCCRCCCTYSRYKAVAVYSTTTNTVEVSLYMNRIYYTVYCYSAVFRREPSSIVTACDRHRTWLRRPLLSHSQSQSSPDSSSSSVETNGGLDYIIYTRRQMSVPLFVDQTKFFADERRCEDQDRYDKEQMWHVADTGRQTCRVDGQSKGKILFYLIKKQDLLCCCCCMQYTLLFCTAVLVFYTEYRGGNMPWTPCVALYSNNYCIRS